MPTPDCSKTRSYLVVSYSRKELLQTGDGHFSPIGAYDVASDMVLVLDTARFKVRRGGGELGSTKMRPPKS